MKKIFAAKTFYLLRLLIVTICIFSTAVFNKESSTKLKKLAILPFSTLQNDSNTTYLGFAFADQIINKLSYINSIVVQPSSAVGHYDQMEFVIPEVARQLDVKYILVGSYSAQKNRLQLNVELVHAPLNASIWRSSFTVKATEIFIAVDSISSAIIEMLQIQVTAEERNRLHKDIPRNPAAYEYFLKAIATKSSSAVDCLNRARLLEKSIELDSSFAPAIAELGFTYLQYAGKVGGKSGYYVRAEKAMLRAFNTNDESLKTLYYLGLLCAKTGRSEKSASLFKKGLQVNSNSAIFYSGLGYIYRYAGLMEESMQSYRRSQILDSSLKNLVKTQDQITKSLIYQGKYHAANESHNEMKNYLKEMQQSVDVKQLFYEGMIHFYAKDWDNAYALFDSASVLDSTSVWSTFGQAYKQAVLKKTKHLQTILKRLEARNIVDGERRYRLVHFYALLGNQENALRNLKLSIEGGFFNYPYINHDPLLDNLRDTKMFKTLLDRARQRHDSFKQKFGDKL